ncbi:MAG: roadblock/LC7 domain-containing protein, partial [Promethearchaeota archaeon]
MEPYSSDDIKRKKRKDDPLLNKLLGAVPEVTSAAIVSAEGLPIASALPQGVDETRIAAMTSALLSLSERAIIEMGIGNVDRLYIKGSEGYLLVMQAGQNAALTVTTTKDVRLELILLDCRRICEKISRLLGGDINDDDVRYPYPYVLKPPELSRYLKKKYDATFKIIIFGDVGCGKRTLTQRFVTNSFVSNQTITMTIGVDFEVKSISVDGQKVKLQIWDFGGEERFRFLLRTYVRGARGALFLYDITNFSSIA